MSLSDDEIEIVADNSTTSLSVNNDICQLCSLNLDGLSDSEREQHYDTHLGRKGSSGQSSIRSSARSKRGQPRAASTHSKQQKTTSMKLSFGKDTKKAAQEDDFWYPAQERAPPDNYSPGVLTVLKEALKKSYRKGSTQRAVLCYERTPHIYRESFDTNWGCGYRNFLMACAALMDQPFQGLYFPILDTPLPPGVRNLQRWIEDAWEQGYDDSGANDLRHKLVNTKTRIGTAELYVAFTYRRIPCMLVDFNIEKAHKGFDTLMDWVVKYFTPKPSGDVNTMLLSTSPVVATDKMPIILQYSGHSMTIVGYELEKNGKYNLLVFDPSSKVDEKIRQAALDMSNTDVTSSSSTPLGKGKRYGLPDSPLPKKRQRTNQNSDEIVSIPDSDGDKTDDPRALTDEFTLDPDMVIKAFKYKKSKPKPDYQLLYFPMEAPLSDQEQADRKVVQSVREC